MQVSDANVRWSHTNSEMCGDGCIDYSEGFLQEFQSIEFSKKYVQSLFSVPSFILLVFWGCMKRKHFTLVKLFVKLGKSKNKFILVLMNKHYS